MADNEKTTDQTTAEAALPEEMEAVAEPLSLIEKKLILGSLGLGISLLIILILATGAYKF